MEVDLDPPSIPLDVDSPRGGLGTRGRTPPVNPTMHQLHAACAAGDLPAARYAVVCGADVGRPDDRGWRPLHHAAAAGHAHVVTWLLGAGARHRAPGRQSGGLSGATALHVAVACGHTEVVATLLAAGADPNAHDDAGFAPLHIAALQGDLLCARALLLAGAHPGAWLADDTPLDLALRGGHRALAGLLRQVARRPRLLT